MFVYMQKQFVPKARICKKRQKKKELFQKSEKRKIFRYRKPFVRTPIFAFVFKGKKIFVGKYNQYFWRVFKEVNNRLEVKEGKCNRPFGSRYFINFCKWKEEEKRNLLILLRIYYLVMTNVWKKNYELLSFYSEKKKKETVRSKALLEMFGYLCAWMSFWRKKNIQVYLLHSVFMIDFSVENQKKIFFFVGQF